MLIYRSSIYRGKKSFIFSVSGNLANVRPIFPVLSFLFGLQLSRSVFHVFLVFSLPLCYLSSTVSLYLSLSDGCLTINQTTLHQNVFLACLGFTFPIANYCVQDYYRPVSLHYYLSVYHAPLKLALSSLQLFSCPPDNHPPSACLLLSSPQQTKIAIFPPYMAPHSTTVCSPPSTVKPPFNLYTLKRSHVLCPVLSFESVS